MVSSSGVLDSPTYESRYPTVKMCGRNVRPVGQFAKIVPKDKYKESHIIAEELGVRRNPWLTVIGFIWKYTFGYIEEWVILFLMAIIIACVSFVQDKVVMACLTARNWLFYDIAVHPFEKYVAWISLPITLILFSHGWMAMLTPCPGSGLPELKTILCGVELKGFLNFNNLLAKFVGAAATVASGMPLGKKGPLIHIACVTIRLLRKLVLSFHGIHESEGNITDMLAVAIAVGVACSFYAPIAGVLMSIELTTSYFSVRNYWRGFFAAVCGATFYRFLYVWNKDIDTIGPAFKTNFPMDVPFHSHELLMFGSIGIICGFFGAFFVFCHRQYATFLKTNKFMISMTKNCRFLYPGLVSWGIASALFMPGFGQFIAGDMPHGGHVNTLFSNFPWTKPNLTIEQQMIVNKWKSPYTGIFINLLLFICYTFIAAVVAATIPVPSGTFIPVFKIGAAFGRIIGESMHLWWLYGYWYPGNKKGYIIPGGYAAVGAAAMAASVTRTISVALILFEMTGQLTHVIPVLIAVLIANGVGSLIAPSMFDSVIVVKKLPYLPELLPTESAIYNVVIEDFMNHNVKYVHLGMNFANLKKLLKDNMNIKNFPLVDSPEHMVLLGSIHRMNLINLINQQIGRSRRLFAVVVKQRWIELKQNENFEEINDNDGEQVTYITKQLQQIPIFTEAEENTKPSVKSKIRNVFQVLLSKPPAEDLNNTVEYEKYTPKIFPTSRSDFTQTKRHIVDMSPEERTEWEEKEMNKTVNFSICEIDSAPFQCVKGTSLLKIHTFFSRVGINVAYVTSKSRLIGVVGFKDIRKIIDDVNNGKAPQPQLKSSNSSAETILIDNKVDNSTVKPVNV